MYSHASNYIIHPVQSGSDWVDWKCFFDAEDDFDKGSIHTHSDSEDDDVDDVDDDDDINDGEGKQGEWDQISFYPRTFLCRGSQYTTA